MRPRSLLFAALLAASASRADVVVVEAAPGGEAARAKLKAGDRLVSWQRGASKKAEAASGAFAAPWDLEELEASEVPRGRVRVTFVRSRRTFSVRLGRGEWRLTVRPDAEGRDAELARTLSRAAAAAAAARHAEALELWKDALSAAERRHDALLRARILVLEPPSFRANRQLPAAEAALREAVAIRERTDPSGPAAASALTLLAGHLRQSKQDRAAGEALATRALEIAREEASGSLVESRALRQLGSFAWDRGQVGEYRARNEAALALARRLAPDGIDTVQCLSNVAFALGEAGDLRGSERLQKEALAIAQKRFPEAPETGQIWNGLGVLARERGDLVASDERLQKAYEIWSRTLPGTLSVAGVLANLANNALDRGELGLAEERHRTLLAMREAIAPEGNDVGRSCQSLANILRVQGRPVEATAFAERAVAVARRNAPGGIAEASALCELGRADLASGRLEAAEEHLRAGLAIAGKVAPFGRDAAALRTALAEILMARGRLEEAETVAADAVARRRSQPGTISEAQALRLLASVQRARGKLDEAEATYGRTLASLETQAARIGGGEESAAAFSSRAADAYQDTIDLLLSRAKNADALAVLERSRARHFLVIVKAREKAVSLRLPEGIATERSALSRAQADAERRLAALDPEREAESVAALEEELRVLRGRRVSLDARLEASDPALGPAFVASGTLDLAGIRRVLPRGTLLLSYTVLPARTVLFAVRAEGDGEEGEAGLDVLSIPVASDALAREIGVFRGLVVAGSEGDVAAPALLEQARRLHDLLVAPAAGLFARAARVLIAADGPLQTLPFAALRDEEQWLAEKKPMSFAPSASAWASLRGRAARQTRSSARLVAFADPTLPGRAEPGGEKGTRGSSERGGAPLLRYRRGLAPLPYAREEARAVARAWKGPSAVFAGDDATKARALGVGTGTRVLHFATHALVDRRFPLDSGLALASNGADATGEATGLLQAWEVLESMRLDADLVTLSGCETGLGAEGTGEGLVGLVRAFQIAGARSVVASLWSVSDRSTRDLMIRFYEALGRGAAKDEALVQAQRALIRGTPEGRNLGHPRFWAAFEVFGDGR